MSTIASNVSWYCLVSSVEQVAYYYGVGGVTQFIDDWWWIVDKIMVSSRPIISVLFAFTFSKVYNFKIRHRIACAPWYIIKM